MRCKNFNCIYLKKFISPLKAHSSTFTYTFLTALSLCTILIKLSLHVTSKCTKLIWNFALICIREWVHSWFLHIHILLWQCMDQFSDLPFNDLFGAVSMFWLYYSVAWRHKYTSPSLCCEFLTFVLIHIHKFFL